MPDNISEERRKLLDRMAQPAKLRFRWDERRGVASVLRGDLSKSVGFRPGQVDPPSLATEKFVRNYGALIGPRDLWDRIAPLSLRIDKLHFVHLDYQVRHPSGIEVYGARVVAHFDVQRRLVQVQSSSPPSLDAEVRPTVTSLQLKQILVQRNETLPGYAELERRRALRDLPDMPDFPLVGRPRLVLYPWQQALRLSYVAYGFGPRPERSRPLDGSASHVQFGQLFIDARTGEAWRFAPTRSCMAEVPASGAGRGVAPHGGDRPWRLLDVVRVDGGSTYRLRNTTHARDIVIHDAAGNADLWPDDLPAAFASSTLPVSADGEGDHAWKKAAGASSTDTTRTASQQPEVEAAYLAARIYEWYDTLAGGRAGWDAGWNEGLTAPTTATAISVPDNLPVRLVTHWPDPDTRAVRSPAASFEMGVSGNQWHAWIALSDGDPKATCQTQGDRGFEYVASSPTIVAHEYAHAITNFSFRDGDGNPGLFGSGSMSWHNALHEGIADAMGCLYAGDWYVGRDVSRHNLAFRNLAFPRDASAWMNQPLIDGKPACGLGGHNLDHFADAGPFTGDLCHYDRGTIIGHCAFLMAAGGMHVRTERDATFIPVRGMGNLSTARIFYRAVTEYLGTVGAETGVASIDDDAFFKLADGLRSAAADLFGPESREYHTTDLALYAVGLQTFGETYGAEVTCASVGADWAGSMPFVGIFSPTTASVDLMVLNAGDTPWTARVNVRTTGGTATTFENLVYCRLRNVGDVDAVDIRADFFYSGMGADHWLPVVDKDGQAQSLSIALLEAGAVTFLDTEQDNPPAAAQVRWCIPPPPQGQTVSRLRLRAVITTSGDRNPFDKEVRSEIACSAYVP